MPKKFHIDHLLNQAPKPITHQIFPSESNETYSVCIGDLNGDFLGLLVVLLQMGHISCKNKENPEVNWSKIKAFSSFVRDDRFWAASRQITPKNSLDEAIGYIRELINTEFDIHPNPKINEIIFLGPILYGSGASAFIILAILHFFSKKINYKIIHCYYDTMAALYKFDMSYLHFGQEISSFNDIPCLRLTADWDEKFRSLYKISILDKSFIFINKFEDENTFLISNQQRSKQVTTNLLETFFLEKNIANITNINIFLRFKIWALLSENDTHAIQSNKFIKSVLETQNHLLFESLSKSPRHFRTTYLFLRETHQSQQITFAYNVLNETNDLKLLKIVLRKFSGISYFLDDKHIESIHHSAEYLHSSAHDKNASFVLSNINLIAPLLSQIQRHVFIENIEHRIAFLRSKRGVQITKKTNPILNRLFVETNLFGLCCTLALLWIQNRIIVKSIKLQTQGRSFDATPIKFQKKDFYFRLVRFNQKIVEFLRLIFLSNQNSIDNYCEELSNETWREIETFIDTPAGRETAEALRGYLHEIFDIQSSVDSVDTELVCVDRLRSAQSIGFMNVAHTHIADAVSSIILKMIHKNIDELFLYFVISDQNRQAASSHAVAMSIEILKPQEIKIRLYDPNETKGHYKTSFFALSTPGLNQQVKLFFQQPVINRLWVENSFTSIFCIQLNENIPQVELNILSEINTLRPEQCTQEYRNQFYFVALKNLILNTATPTTCFPIEVVFHELLDQIMPTVSPLTPTSRDDYMRWFLDTMYDSNSGNTLLMLAVHFRNLRVVRFLLNAGSDPNIPNIKDNHNSARSYAIQYYHENPTNTVEEQISLHIEQKIRQQHTTPK